MMIDQNWAREGGEREDIACFKAVSAIVMFHEVRNAKHMKIKAS